MTDRSNDSLEIVSEHKLTNTSQRSRQAISDWLLCGRVSANNTVPRIAVHAESVVLWEGYFMAMT